MDKRHIFIINPAAGGRDNSSKAVKNIEDACRELGLEYDIYLTSHPTHATDIVKKTAAAHDNKQLVFYACGGDGTLNEVANGMLEIDRRHLFTAYPIGTGNDFIKLFEGGRKAFLDLNRLLTGIETDIDCILSDCGCSVNILSVGIDAQVTMRKGKYNFLGGGILPYCAAAVESVMRGIGREYYVNIDGVQKDGDYSMIFVGNGRVYGGGFCPVPDSRIDDGELDVLLVKKVTRLQAGWLITKYKKGKYRELTEYIEHIRAKEIKVFSKDNADMCINLDGETVESSHISLRIEPKRLSFVLPKGSKLLP